MSILVEIAALCALSGSPDAAKARLEQRACQQELASCVRDGGELLDCVAGGGGLIELPEPVNPDLDLVSTSEPSERAKLERKIREELKK